MEMIFLIPGAFFAPVIHELTKAVTSTAQGDPTPRSRGFLTPNPFRFFEPVGFVLMLFFGGFGWGQPVPTSALHYKNRRRTVLATYLTPIFINLLVGALAVAALSAWMRFSLEGAGVTTPYTLPYFLELRGYFFRNFEWDALMIGKIVLFYFAQCNVMLALFNFLPVHPLAGSHILRLFAKPDTLVKLNHFEKPMQIIMILAVALGVVGMLANPVWSAIVRVAWVF